MKTVWTADPNGAYWNENKIWSRGNGRLLENTHYYNCRARAENGVFEFNSYLPGYYKESDWRPRHIHLRVVFKNGNNEYNQYVAQLYFHGDRFLGDADIGCCNSGNPGLLLYLSLGNERSFSLCDLHENACCAKNEKFVLDSTKRVKGHECVVSNDSSQPEVATETASEDEWTKAEMTTETPDDSGSTKPNQNSQSGTPRRSTISRFIVWTCSLSIFIARL